MDELFRKYPRTFYALIDDELQSASIATPAEISMNINKEPHYRDVEIILDGIKMRLVIQLDCNYKFMVSMICGASKVSDNFKLISDAEEFLNSPGELDEKIIILAKMFKSTYLKIMNTSLCFHSPKRA